MEDLKFHCCHSIELPNQVAGVWDCASYELLLQTESRRRILLDASLCPEGNLLERLPGVRHFLGPIFKFVSILGHNFFSFVHSGTIKMEYRVCFRVPKMRFCVRSR